MRSKGVRTTAYLTVPAHEEGDAAKRRVHFICGDWAKKERLNLSIRPKDVALEEDGDQRR
jgi:hypothetical protein